MKMFLKHLVVSKALIVSNGLTLGTPKRIHAEDLRIKKCLLAKEKASPISSAADDWELAT
jgi:hypothetical protein